MHHSITFGDVQNDTRNTWTDWKLMPESPPVVPSPKPKTNYVDIPGRARGPIDASMLPFNRHTYERITGSFLFVMRDDFWYTPNPRNLFNAARGWLHGRRTQMRLEDEPDFIYYGMFTVEAPKLGQGPFALQIGFDLEPVRYNVDGSVDRSWLVDAASWADDTPYVPELITSITDPEIHELFI